MEWGLADAVVWRNRALMLFDRVAVPVAVCDVYGKVVLANPAMAAECGTSPGQLRGRDVLELFRPEEAGQVERIAQALRLRHRSRYQVSVSWSAPGGTERYGELTA
ncbi:PAS domain S-box protein, partial [Streptomyces sp. SID1328]|uniref:PAS domain S-box protein n=1 Tax=Streptomyces sp. SID1328 TaxID=2690250 RepID=UPI00136ED5BB|nr:PAS domain S-box protein [Streptomyces sp. SID1328]